MRSWTRAPASGPGISVRPAGRTRVERLVPSLEELVVELERAFRTRREKVLRDRSLFRQKLLSGSAPGFPPDSSEIRRGDWSVSPAPPALADRRVEITGPTDRKMVVNALNSGASAYMADFEDAHAPAWGKTLEGQQNLFDAIRRKIDFVDAAGKPYRLLPRTATLMMRPRGWHLEEPNVLIDGRPVSASLFDFGVFVHQNGRELVRGGAGVYLYLPKLEHASEARLWNDVFGRAEEVLGLPHATCRATVLIETLPAVFEMDEILYELRERALGLNCGRWDYIFSFIKQFRHDPEYTLPDRSQLTMDLPFLRSYARLLIRTCHRRGTHAIGGMAADIPVKNDPEANARAIERVTHDKEREVQLGHDGTWVAHPALVPVAKAVFDRAMPSRNQIDRDPPGPSVGPRDLVEVPKGSITASGVRSNVRVAVRYLTSWLDGSGAVAIDHRMEDAATAEIARSQLWQWVHHHARLDSGETVDLDRVRQLLRDEEAMLHRERRAAGLNGLAVRQASALLDQVVTGDHFVDFITFPASQLLAADVGSTGGP
ncbi:MAG TPA: malate synthase A [Thermoplasmata archaeon]|nr:malate synthase A [Thermoplasmata archaeon]